MRSTRHFTTLMRLSVLAVLAAMSSAASPARADIIKQNVFYGQSISGAGEMFFNPFDPALGTLTDVTLQIIVLYTPKVFYESCGICSSLPPTIDLTTTLDIQGLTFPPPLQEIVLGTQVGVPLGPPGCFVCSATGQSAGKALTLDFPASEFGLFAPPPPTALLALINTTGVSGGVDLGSGEFVTSGGFSGTLTYDFVPVPEPSSLALMLSALVCLCGVLRISGRKFASPLAG
jgi:hypothetical protein